MIVAGFMVLVLIYVAVWVGWLGFWFAGLVVLRVFGFAGYVVLVRLGAVGGFGCAGVASS